MKKALSTRVPRYSLSVLTLAILAACGGGGSSDSSDSTNNGATAPAQQVTGKAIDGYLAGATVCVDTNNNGSCDAGEVRTTTDQTGSFALPYDQSVVGQKLLVQVTATTRDLSRPAGFMFPAGFVLSRLISGQGSQHVTPFTTMISAQMDSGLTESEARRSVQAFLGANVTPDTDFVATNDAATSALARRVVDKLTSFGGDAATQRNVLNAIIAAGTVESVDQAAVAAQARKPAFSLANAKEVLSQQTYSFRGYLVSVYEGAGLPETEALVRQRRQLVGARLETSQEENQPHGGDTWVTVPIEKLGNGKYDGLLGAYQLRADGSWSDFRSALQATVPESLSRAEAQLAGQDAQSGIAFTVDYRQSDLSGLPLALATPRFVDPGLSSFIDFSVLPAFENTAFPDGTKAFLSIRSYAADRIVLPVAVPPCDSATVTADHVGFDCVIGSNQPLRYHWVLGNPATRYTSVQQAIGLALADLTKSARLAPDGTATVGQAAGTWTTYSANPNVLVVEVPNEGASKLASSSGWYAPFMIGAKLVVALHEGRLRFGWLYPQDRPVKAIEFRSALPVVLVDALQQASAHRPR